LHAVLSIRSAFLTAAAPMGGDLRFRPLPGGKVSTDQASLGDKGAK